MNQPQQKTTASNNNNKRWHFHRLVNKPYSPVWLDARNVLLTSSDIDELIGDLKRLQGDMK